jgi:hypothetical protein
VRATAAPTLAARGVLTADLLAGLTTAAVVVPHRRSGYGDAMTQVSAGEQQTKGMQSTGHVGFRWVVRR